MPRSQPTGKLLYENRTYGNMFHSVCQVALGYSLSSKPVETEIIIYARSDGVRDAAMLFGGGHTERAPAIPNYNVCQRHKLSFSIDIWNEGLAKGTEREMVQLIASLNLHEILLSLSLSLLVV